MSTTPPANPNDPKKPVPPPAGGKPTPPAGTPTPKPQVTPAPQQGAKPTGGTPAPKPTGTSATPGKPAAPGAGGAKPTGAPPQAGARTPGTGAAKPPQAGAGAPAKPPATGGKPAPTPKPAAPKPQKAKHTHVDSGSRQLGQKLVDLGYLDDAQLDSIYEEMRTSERKLGELAIDRGLLNDDQLLQATAEVHGMKVATLEEAKPTPESIKIVPQNMAELYKMVPLAFDADTLTVAMSDPNNLQALDDIRNFLGIRQVTAVLAPAHASRSAPSSPNWRATRSWPRSAPGGKPASTCKT